MNITNLLSSLGVDEKARSGGALVVETPIDGSRNRRSQR